MAGNVTGQVTKISDGYISLTPVALKRCSVGDLQALQNEIEKQTREVRSDVPDQDDLPSVQKRNRRMQRLSQARLVLQTYRKKMRR